MTLVGSLTAQGFANRKVPGGSARELRSYGAGMPDLRHATASVQEARDRALSSPVHDDRTAAILGIALGLSFLTCFLTGLVSHFIQHPTSWFHWQPRPAGLYRLTQGLHVATGLASIPLLLAKLWSVFPNLFRWPPVASIAHAVERIMLVPLVCGSVFMLFSGAANIAKWYPWHFSFPAVHYLVGWMTMGALVTHLGAKATITRHAVFPSHRVAEVVAPQPASVTGTSRRGFLGAAAAAVGFLTLTTVGQTVRPLRRLALFSPRRPDIGPQGLPINGTASASLIKHAQSPKYKLRIRGNAVRNMTLSLADLQGFPQHSARLPIACVEGWSADADWTGVPVRELLRHAGVAESAKVEATVTSLQRGSLYRESQLSNAQARDPDTLLALQVNGDQLHIDHGFPCRLIGPNRPGVQQTKWVAELTVRHV